MRSRPTELRPETLEAVVAFLRDWLGPDATRIYRAMIRADPENWSRDPHFASGVIVQHALRGNGLDEVTLDVADLDPLWPEILELAVTEEPTP